MAPVEGSEIGSLAGLSGPDIAAIVTAAAAQVGARAECGAILEGSLAEGFGNENSDIDIVFVDEGEREHLTMPSILFIAGRRVEVRRRSSHQVRAQVAEVRRHVAKGNTGLRSISRDLLDRVQRFARSRVVREAPHLGELQAAIGDAELRVILASWYALSSRDAAKVAVAFAAMGSDDSALSWARTAAVHATKSWLARRGETYIEPKWIYEQLLRAPDGLEMQRRLHDAVYTGTNAGSVQDRVQRALDHLPVAGLEPCLADPRSITVKRRRGVTTWSIGDRVHVLRNKRQIYVFGSRAGSAWRTLPLGRTLAEVVEQVSAAGAPPNPLLPELYRLGLISLHWKGEGELKASPPSGGTPSAVTPPLTLEGGTVPEQGDAGIYLSSLPAAQFVEAGMSLVWTNVIVENAIEDAVGAVGRGQWGVLSVVVRRAVRYMCIAVLGGYGAGPWPPAEEGVSVLTRLDLVPHELCAEAYDLESSPVARDEAEAHALLDRVRGLVRALRKEAGTELFPGSFEGDSGWRDTLGLGNDWLRLAAYMGVLPPKEEAQDVVGGMGGSRGGRRQPR